MAAPPEGKKRARNMKFKLLAGAALAAVFAAGAAQAAEPGWYGAVDLGWHWDTRFEVKSANPAPNATPYKWNLGQKDDWAGFGRLGYQFNPNWRVELEVGYKGGDIRGV